MKLFLMLSYLALGFDVKFYSLKLDVTDGIYRYANDGKAPLPSFGKTTGSMEVFLRNLLTFRIR